MTQEEAEAIYDAEIAPELLRLTRRCAELGFAIVSHVEWWPGETGITQSVTDAASLQMQMTHLAARAHGNYDALGIALLKSYDCRGSLFLNQYSEKQPT